MVPFREHEWYQTLAGCMHRYCADRGIELEVVDSEQHWRDNLALHAREIAAVAAAQVGSGDVILIDAGPIATYLAEALAEREHLTVITNALAVFECLRESPGLTLILTGGVFRRDSNALSGPTAQLSLRELRADKLFLTVSGITAEFGLSHTDLAEVAMKQAMIRAAREVIVLADHSKFGQESIAQVAPLSVVNRLITDNALPAATRLELSKAGIEVIIAPAG